METIFFILFSSFNFYLLIFHLYYEHVFFCPFFQITNELFEKYKKNIISSTDIESGQQQNVRTKTLVKYVLKPKLSCEVHHFFFFWFSFGYLLFYFSVISFLSTYCLSQSIWYYNFSIQYLQYGLLSSCSKH